MQSNQSLVLLPVKPVSKQQIDQHILQRVDDMNPQFSKSSIKYIKRIGQLRQEYGKQLPMQDIDDLTYQLKLNEEYLVLFQIIESSVDIGRGLIIEWKSPLKGETQKFSNFKDEAICIKINIIYLSFNLALFSQNDFKIDDIKKRQKYVATILKQIQNLLPIVKRCKTEIPELCPETLTLIQSLTKGIQMKMKLMIEEIFKSSQEQYLFKKLIEYVYSTYNRFRVCSQEFLAGKAKLESILPSHFVAKLQSYILREYFYFKTKLYFMFGRQYFDQKKTQLSKQCYVCAFQASQQFLNFHNSFAHNSEIKSIQQRTVMKLQQLKQKSNINVNEQVLQMEMKKLMVGCSHIVGEVVYEWRDNWKQLIDEAKSAFTNLTFSMRNYEKFCEILQVELKEVIESCENIVRKSLLKKCPVDIQESVSSIQGLKEYSLISVAQQYLENEKLINKINDCQFRPYLQQKNNRVYQWLMKNQHQNYEQTNLQELEEAIYRNDIVKILNILGYVSKNLGSLQQQFNNAKALTLKLVKQAQQAPHSNLLHQIQSLNPAQKKQAITEAIKKLEYESIKKKQSLDEIIAKFFEEEEKVNIWNEECSRKIKILEEYFLTNQAIFKRLIEIRNKSIAQALKLVQNSEINIFDQSENSEINIQVSLGKNDKKYFDQSEVPKMFSDISIEQSHFIQSKEDE